MSSSLRFEISSVAFFGRSFSEYIDLFDFDLDSLPLRRVLDVAAGPSSFTAEATRRGIASVAVDPLYGLSLAALQSYVRMDYDRVLTEIRRKPQLCRLGYYASIDEVEASRRAAADRFLADYEQGFPQERYIGGKLPQLPFPDGAFDLVLCAHLLFTYAHLFDYEWHLAACRELCRVSSCEVRIHPVCGNDGAPYPEIPRLLQDLRNENIGGKIISLNFEFFAGANRTLMLRRGSEML
jgi:SAM-dependent methyltransferase